MKRFWQIVNRWWAVITLGFLVEGLEIMEAYVARGKMVFGGEYLIMPAILMLIALVEQILAEIKGDKDDRRSNEDR